MIKYTKEEFLERAKKIHGNRYDYSKVNYVNLSTKIIIICHIHGEFLISPQKHLIGQGCRKCGYIKNIQSQSSTTKEFVKKAKKIHGNKYDYSKVEYVNNSTKVCIICPIHGEFWQTPNSHLNGRGCKKCGIIKRTYEQRSNTNEFIEKSKLIHGNRYDYSKVEYISNRIPVIITCPEHGDFKQVPYHHIGGEGCPKCKYENISQSQRLTINEVIKRFIETHGNKYDYSKVEYKGVDNKVCIICPKHGEFWQEPWVHIKGCGCPKCASTLSINETELLSKIKEYVGENKVLERVRSLFDDTKEYDIVVPEHNLCIEYDGLYWHSSKFDRVDKNYHLEKTLKCNENGYRLIHIFEDEYVNNKDIVLSKIKHILNVDYNLINIGARKCFVKEIDKNMANTFLNKNHIQGFASSTIYLGLYYKEILVSVMCFKKEKADSKNWELTRFAVDNNYNVCGAGGKLFKYFTRIYSPEVIKSFADRRWSQDEPKNLYRKLGFVLDKILPPDYKYFDSKSKKLKRLHKFNCRKDRLHKKYGLPLSMTEREMTDYLKFYRIYDCGLYKYVWMRN